MRIVKRVGAAERAFQSAPGREAGRCLERTQFAQNANVFQSAPGREAGRCAKYW